MERDRSRTPHASACGCAPPPGLQPWRACRAAGGRASPAPRARSRPGRACQGCRPGARAPRAASPGAGHGGGGGAHLVCSRGTRDEGACRAPPAGELLRRRVHGVRRVARAKAARGGACSPKQVLPPDRRPQSKYLVGRLGARQVGPCAIACHAGARGRLRDRRHPSLPPWQWVHLRLAPGRPRGKILSTLRGHRTVKSAGSLPAVVQLWWQAAIDRSREFSARNARSTSGRRRECACVRYAPTILGTSREVPSKNFTLTADRDKISTAQNCGRVPGRARAAPLRVAHFRLHISRDFGHTFLVPWGTELKIAILRFVQGSDLELGTPILEFGTL